MSPISSLHFAGVINKPKNSKVSNTPSPEAATPSPEPEAESRLLRRQATPDIFTLRQLYQADNLSSDAESDYMPKEPLVPSTQPPKTLRKKAGHRNLKSSLKSKKEWWRGVTKQPSAAFRSSPFMSEDEFYQNCRIVRNTPQNQDDSFEIQYSSAPEETPPLTGDTNTTTQRDSSLEIQPSPSRGLQKRAARNNLKENNK